jgi:DNA polymerase III gamma/tau subunit
LKGVPDAALEALVEVIAEQERITCDPDVLEVLIRTSCGSPRDALSKLSLLRGCSREEAFALLEEPEARQEIITLARELAAGREISWANLCNLLKQCNESAESIRLMLVNYLGSVLLNTKREEEACRLLSILEHFSTPFAANEKMAPLLLAFGKCLFATE